jgi:hypothetical protein
VVTNISEESSASIYSAIFIDVAVLSSATLIPSHQTTHHCIVFQRPINFILTITSAPDVTLTGLRNIFCPIN